MTQGYTGAETVSRDALDPASRFVGTNSLTDLLKASTPGQEPDGDTPQLPGERQAAVLKRVVTAKRNNS